MPKAVILALLKQVASFDLPEILVEVEKGIFKIDNKSAISTLICYNRYKFYHSHPFSCRNLHN